MEPYSVKGTHSRVGTAAIVFRKDGLGDADDPVKNLFEEAIKSLSGEIYVDLSYRSIVHIPSSANDPAQFLQVFAFEHFPGNKLKELPNSFFTNFPALRRLDLRFNALKSIPPTVGDHTFLEVLLLQDNLIKKLPRDIVKSSRLRRLQLSGNPLIWPPPNVTSQGLDAIMLYLHNNSDDEQTVRAELKSPLINQCETFSQHGPIKSSDLTLDIPTEAEKQTKLSDQNLTVYQTHSKQNLHNNCSKRKQTGSKKQFSQNSSQTIKTMLKESRTRIKKGSSHALAIIHGRRFPLGYSKRSSSFIGSRIYKALIEQIWLNQLKQILQSQDHTLQKLKEKDALIKWRQETQQLQNQVYQPKWTGLHPPYDFDAGYLKMMTRAGLLKFQSESLEKKCHSKPPPLPIKVLDLQEKMNQLIASFDKLKTSQSHLDEHDPQTRCKLLAAEMEKIRKLHQAVQALRLKV